MTNADSPAVVGDSRRLQIERLVAGGDAMARDADGRVVFVEGALPGETVDVEFIVVKRDFARARLN
ncbi:MAG: TRAM domain-containing protein, partial [Acidimicrobiaceae bacterium]|nr:TRAM domain-containing protein [Acidimicrobiaceae bacterium]